MLATDPAAVHDVPAWARMRGHEMVGADRAGRCARPHRADARMTTGPAPEGDRAAASRSDQLNEPPHAQALPAFGLSIVKPCFSIVSAKSIVAPSR